MAAMSFFCIKHKMNHYTDLCPMCRDGDDGEFVPFSALRVENISDPSGIRPVLYDFALQMEKKLRKNDSKTGWRTLPIEALFRLLMLEIEEFKVGHEFFGKEEARKELVDVANFCMILHDRLGMEEDKNDGVTK